MSTLAVIGAVTGGIGLAVSLLNYFRDAPRVNVYLRFDLTPHDGGEKVAFLTIFNAGRRAIYLERAHIPPVRKGGKAVIFEATLQPILLKEGGKPFRAPIDHAAFVESGLAEQWWRVRVKVWDAAMRSYRSRWIVEKPSFANEDAPPGAILLGRLLNAASAFRLRLLA